MLFLYKEVLAIKLPWLDAQLFVISLGYSYDFLYNLEGEAFIASFILNPAKFVAIINAQHQSQSDIKIAWKSMGGDQVQSSVFGVKVAI